MILAFGQGYSDKFPRPSATQHTSVPVFIVHTIRSLAERCLTMFGVKSLSFWEGCDFIFTVQCNVTYMSGHGSWLLVSRVPDTKCGLDWNENVDIGQCEQYSFKRDHSGYYFWSSALAINMSINTFVTQDLSSSNSLAVHQSSSSAVAQLRWGCIFVWSALVLFQINLYFVFISSLLGSQAETPCPVPAKSHKSLERRKAAGGAGLSYSGICSWGSTERTQGLDFEKLTRDRVP